jgi:hypothetical protein
MEFLRFGSSIPGSYWGCCAVDIIQNFAQDPDQQASIQLVNGDGGTPITKDGESLFAGKTWREIFWQRLRVGTFDRRDLPNHGFLAIMTEGQIRQGNGLKWLAILKEAGFEFIRTVSNSVYAGSGVGDRNPTESNNANYIFGLFRNIGNGYIIDQFRPPQEWLDMGAVCPEPGSIISANIDTRQLTNEVRAAQRAVWDTHPVGPFLKESELEAEKIPVIYAGVRSDFPQQSKMERGCKLKEKGMEEVNTPDPFEDDDDYVDDEEFESL